MRLQFISSRNRRILLTLSVLLLSIPAALSAQEISLNGYVRSYTGALLNGNNEYAIVQNTLNLNLEHSKGMGAFKANPYFYQYSDGTTEIGLREAYMDLYFRSVDVRIGKQQVIWGKADGVFITDIVSPKDLREFLLPDFDEIRMGVTAVKVNYYLGDHTFALVWIPVFTPTRMPDENSIWRPNMEFIAPVNFDYSKVNVTGSLKNSEVLAKYSLMTSAVDIEVMAGTSWDDDPTMHITKNINPETGQLAGLTVTPQHHRLDVFGGSFSATVGPTVLRGETAWYGGKYFNTSDPAATGSVVSRDYLHYLAAVDYTIWDINLSTQFIQQRILDYDKAVLNSETENTMTFLARRDFLRETLTLEFFAYAGFEDDDMLLRPRIYYDLADGFELLLGANIFTGSSGRFGQYNANDMGYFKVKYSF